MSKKNVLNVKNMNVSFKSHGQEVKAVRGVSFSVDQGEIVGLVGESGSGKSVTMKAVMQKGPWKRDDHDFPGSDDRTESTEENRKPD